MCKIKAESKQKHATRDKMENWTDVSVHVKNIYTKMIVCHAMAG